MAWSAVFLLLFLVGLLDECFDEWLDDRELRPVELLDDLEPELLELLLESEVDFGILSMAVTFEIFVYS